ncbi:SGNH/GDSL hydrolase family protein [Cylindrospermum sp. FACHB-282]|uniref:SGNH/GDSL hydrolase family protein n=1 Tax=Cylindrospermum sp. FACHB-282 TaxID=2692794 RepID=UPI00168796A6|nr:SGNH/GDSL hydrolase family protein [Cylindrospermum sp. FACHB-282]MBD2388460.1 SGNH/GDSL hydrolase family protein [Cylindrospermum sp. FACHB-282]
MKNQVVAAGFAIFSFMLPLKANAGTISQIYAFGDSLVDNGNAYELTGGAVPPSEYYYNGHFSNGSVWVEYLANHLGIQETNYAFGGATTGIYNTIKLPTALGTLPGLTQQVQSFVADYPQADENALYVVWAGANDYLGAGVTNPLEPVNNLATTVATLASVGAKNFLVANLPDLGNLPATNGSPYSGGLSYLTGLHNSALSQTLNALDQQQPNLNITLFDINSLLSRAIASPAEFGFTNVTDSCFNSVTQTICTNPNEYIFWDAIHPTTYTYKIVAGAALVAVPEPSPALGMLALSVLGATGVLKGKQKKVTAYPSKFGF